MNRWINYHHLYYFKTIAEEGSVSKASAKLKIGQPALSAQLKQFEDNLGVQLFERQHKKLILTEHGRVALDYSKTIFRLGSEMFEVLNDNIRPQKTTVHIGALDSIPKSVILKLVEQSLKTTECQITLSEGKSDELLRELSSHNMDLMITNFLPAGTEARSLHHKQISKQNVAFYGVEKFKNLRKNFPTSLSGVPLILPTFDSKLRQDIEHWARLNKIDLNIVIESQDISVKELMAIHGVGVIPSATPILTDQSKNKIYEIGKLQGISEELFLVSANRKIENSVASYLMNNFKMS